MLCKRAGKIYLNCAMVLGHLIQIKVPCVIRSRDVLQGQAPPTSAYNFSDIIFNVNLSDRLN